ncbi:MAG: TonB-dependent receptor [Bacteroidia bacterium]|nr:TonB-dependent receptor [Bacteroidia bacterium]
MKRILFILLAFQFSFVVAQEKTDAMLFGDVKSVTTGEHLPYVTLQLTGTHLGTTTDGSGHYKLANLPVGRCLILASSLGYKTKEVEVFMERNKATELFIELEEDILNLEQVVVTATRSTHFIKDVPVRTEVLTAKAIENKNAGNIYQALEGIPGVRVENQCQYCNFTMIRMQGLGAEHTQILINGQPMYSGLAGVYGLQQLSTMDVGRIEIVKGAGSALYGSGAVAGAINIVTKEPSFIPETNVEIQVGNHGTNRYKVSSSMRNEKGNAGLTLFALQQTENAIDETGSGLTHEEVRNPDGISDRVATHLTNAGFSFFVKDALIKNDAFVLRGKSVFETREGGTLTDDYYKNPFTEGTENITTSRYEAEMNYTVKLPLNSEIRCSFGYVNHNRTATNDSFLSDYLDTHNDSTPDLRMMRPYLASENSLSSTLSYTRNSQKHAVIIGVQGFYDKLLESGMYVVVEEENVDFGKPYSSLADKSAIEFGVFVQDEWTVSEKLMVVPGVRLDYHRSGEHYTATSEVFAGDGVPETEFLSTALNPRIAVKYDLSNNITLRANAGTGFRAPYGFSEDLHLCSGSPRVWKSSGLQPEKSRSYNLSADYYGENIRVSGNLFYTVLRDKIGFTGADPDVAAMGYDYQWRNIDDAFVQGIELSVITGPVKNLNLGFDVTFNRGRYRNVREDWMETAYEEISRYISRFPATTGNLMVEYTPRSWSFTLTGSYQGLMYIDYYNEDIDPLTGDQSRIKKTDPYLLFNARAAKTLGNIKLSAGINNIFNYTQDERHLNDAAFMYAPVYGTLFYGSISMAIRH